MLPHKVPINLGKLCLAFKETAFTPNGRVVISDGDAKLRCILGNNAAKLAEQSKQFLFAKDLFIQWR